MTDPAATKARKGHPRIELIQQITEAASDARRRLLGEGDVTIFNIGPDKYSGRVVADVATRKITNVSSALLAAGHARTYSGGHRMGWCANAARWRGREYSVNPGFSRRTVRQRRCSATVS